MQLNLVIRVVRKYIKYNVTSDCCFLFSTVLFFLMEEPIGTVWSWFIANSF